MRTLWAGDPLLPVRLEVDCAARGDAAAVAEGRGVLAMVGLVGYQ